MKKIISLILLATLLLAGCANKDVQTELPSLGEPITPSSQQNFTPKDSKSERTYTPPEMKGELTISILDDSPILTLAAEMFMEKYPDVTVTINKFRSLEVIQLENGSEMSAEPSGEQSSANYLSALNTKLMTGNAEDIIMTGYIPFQKYVDMGAFEDLSFYMENSPEINADSYYMNLFDAVKTTDGKMYTLPLTSFIRIISFHETLANDCQKYLPDTMSKICYEDALNYALELVENTNRKNTLLEISNGQGVVGGILYDKWGDFINPETKEVFFDTQDYISLLEYAAELEAKGYFDTSGLDFYNMEYYFAISSDFDVQAAYYHLLDTSEANQFYHPMPLCDQDGNVNLTSASLFGINSASASKELAWEFLKFMLSDEVQTSPSNWGLSVNKNGFDAYVKRQYDMYNSGNGQVIDWDSYRSLIEGWLLQINDYNSERTVISNMIYDENEPFFEGKKTAADTAKQVQARLDKYLNE